MTLNENNMIKNENIEAELLEIGINSYIHKSAVIRGVSGPAKKIKIGDHCYIGENVQILCDNFELGDYSKIHHNTNIHGYKPCKIGHNAWIGQYCIIDTIGGTTIGNNCGIGAHSQLWSHMKYGDTLEGCKFLSEAPLNIGNDVWFVGHCIVSPITAEDKSMAMVGSVITKNMEMNQVYAGTPAKDITDKIGRPFNQVPTSIKFKKLNNYLVYSKCCNSSIKIVKSIEDFNLNDKISYFDVSSRTYTKKNLPEEIKFMKFLLPEKAKFIPFNSNF